MLASALDIYATDPIRCKNEIFLTYYWIYYWRWSCNSSYGILGQRDSDTSFLRPLMLLQFNSIGLNLQPYNGMDNSFSYLIYYINRFNNPFSISRQIFFKLWEKILHPYYLKMKTYFEAFGISPVFILSFTSITHQTNLFFIKIKMLQRVKNY